MKIELFKDLKLQLTAPAGQRDEKEFYQNSKPIEVNDILESLHNHDLLEYSEINLQHLKSNDVNPADAGQSTSKITWELIHFPGRRARRGAFSAFANEDMTAEILGFNGQPRKTTQRRMIRLRPDFGLPLSKRVKNSETDCKLNIMIHKGERWNQVQDEDISDSERRVTLRVEGALLDSIVDVFTKKFGGEILFELTVSKFLKHYLEERDMEMCQSNSLGFPNKSFMANLGNYLALKTKEMKIVPLATRDNSSVAYCEDEVIIPRAAYHSWVVKKHPVEACFTLAVILKDQEKILRQQVEVTKRIMEKETCWDVTIIASDGTEIRCHKAYLLAHDIPAFKAMLESDFEEAKNSVINMEDMTAEGVKALLDYLYFYRINAAHKKYEIAFQLLNAAEKYGIEKLKDAMIDIIVKKEIDWFTFHDAMEIFVFSMRIQTINAEELKRKAAKILKAKVEKLDAFTEDRLKELLKTHPETGVEMMKYMSSA